MTDRLLRCTTRAFVFCIYFLLLFWPLWPLLCVLVPYGASVMHQVNCGSLVGTNLTYVSKTASYGVTNQPIWHHINR